MLNGHIIICISWPLFVVRLCRMFPARIAGTANGICGIIIVASNGAVSVHGRAVGCMGNIGRCSSNLGLCDTNIGNPI